MREGKDGVLGEIGRIHFSNSQGEKQVEEVEVFSWHGTGDLMISKGLLCQGELKSRPSTEWAKSRHVW